MKYIVYVLRTGCLKRAEQINARNFEIPLAGGFQLSNYVPGLEKYLKVGEEILAYNTPEECVQQVEYYLENEELRREIISKRHERTKKEHMYLYRLETILEEIWK